MKYIATVNDREYVIEINDDHRVLLDGQPVSVDFDSVNEQPVFTLIIDGKSYEAFINEGLGDEMLVQLRGRQYAVIVEDERERRLRAAGLGEGSGGAGEFQLKAPMPGLIVTIPVEEGQVVHKGDVLVILESMKMQNELRTPRDGVVSRINVAAAEGVDQGQVLVVLAPKQS